MKKKFKKTLVFILLLLKTNTVFSGTTEPIEDVDHPTRPNLASQIDPQTIADLEKEYKIRSAVGLALLSTAFASIAGGDTALLMNRPDLARYLFLGGNCGTLTASLLLTLNDLMLCHPDSNDGNAFAHAKRALAHPGLSFLTGSFVNCCLTASGGLDPHIFNPISIVGLSLIAQGYFGYLDIPCPAPYFYKRLLSAFVINPTLPIGEVHDNLNKPSSTVRATWIAAAVGTGLSITSRALNLIPQSAPYNLWTDLAGISLTLASTFVGIMCLLCQ